MFALTGYCPSRHLSKGMRNRKHRKQGLPRTKMIHFTDTSSNLAAVVGAVRFEVQTCRAPYWSSATLTTKDFLGVKVAQIGRIVRALSRFKSRWSSRVCESCFMPITALRNIIWLFRKSAKYCVAFSTPLSRSLSTFGVGVPFRTFWYETRVSHNSVDEPEVT